MRKGRLLSKRRLENRRDDNTASSIILDTADQSVASDATVTLKLSSTASTSILLASFTVSFTPISSFSVQPLTTTTSTISIPSNASSSAESSSKKSSVSAGLVGGLIVTFLVVIAALLFLLVRSQRRRRIVSTSSNQQLMMEHNNGSPLPQRRTSLLGMFPLPPIPSSSLSMFGESNSSHYTPSVAPSFAPSVNRSPMRTHGKQSALSVSKSDQKSSRLSTASWFSLSKSRLWRKSSAQNLNFEWYRSGVGGYEKEMDTTSHDFYDRPSPLGELSEKAAMKMARTPSRAQLVPTSAQYLSATPGLSVPKPAASSGSRSFISFSGDLPDD